jgi:Ca-activated chloride channel family protein
MRRSILSLIVVTAAVVAVQAQDPIAQFSSGVQLVEVYASVTDASGNPVTGLRQSDFEVYEDGERQQVTAFAAGEFPLAVALGVDRSWSMNGAPLGLARHAAESFLKALKPTDRSMVLSISSEAEVLAPISTDRTAQIKAVQTLDPWGTTALHDAIIAGLDRLAPEQGRQALVVFSDGVDRYSTATATKVIDRARRSNALVYPIAFGKTRPALLAELATITGGRSFLLKDAKELEPTLTSIARELRNQYLLGYAPSRPLSTGEGEWRSIRVALKGDRAGVRVRARDGYTAD